MTTVNEGIIYWSKLTIHIAAPIHLKTSIICSHCPPHWLMFYYCCVVRFTHYMSPLCRNLSLSEIICLQSPTLEDSPLPITTNKKDLLVAFISFRTLQSDASLLWPPTHKCPYSTVSCPRFHAARPERVLNHLLL